MLFSNVAGWLHLGCVDTATGCCVDSTLDVSHVQTVKLTCCGHSHAATSTQQDQCADSSKSQSIPIHDDWHHEHDSERCSLCKSFSTLRSASAPALLLLTDFSVEAETTSLPALAAVERSILTYSISVRGPPQV
ncbi:MAG: hypothetical protein CMM01_03600 [Rhodopirellula sp.]|nr:hypothetical protein [Rhodopirellula sp.]